MRRRRLSVELEDEGRARFCRFVPPNREASRGVCHPAAQGTSSAHGTRRRSYRPAPIRSSLRSHLPTFPGLTLVNSPRRAPRPISAHAERVQKGFGVTFSDSKNDETCQFHFLHNYGFQGVHRLPRPARELLIPAPNGTSRPGRFGEAVPYSGPQLLTGHRCRSREVTRCRALPPVSW